MKVLLLLSLALLAGCGTHTTLQELEHQAALSGDWSAVEKRERNITRRKARTGPNCPAGFAGYCESYIGSARCTCVRNDRLRDMMSGLR